MIVNSNYQCESLKQIITQNIIKMIYHKIDNLLNGEDLFRMKKCNAIVKEIAGKYDNVHLINPDN